MPVFPISTALAFKISEILNWAAAKNGGDTVSVQKKLGKYAPLGGLSAEICLDRMLLASASLSPAGAPKRRVKEVVSVNVVEIWV
jgi:hypothetical protein